MRGRSGDDRGLGGPAASSPAARPAARHPPARGAGAGGTPLSPGQQRLWYLSELAPGSAEYNSVSALRLSGRLDVAALNTALAVIAARHEALRSTFDGSFQHVHPPAPLTAQEVDLSALAPGPRAAELDRLLRTHTGRPFDLRRGPLLRVTLLRSAEDEHVLHLAMHHIICDGWSMAVVLTELTACYEAILLGRRPDLPPLTARYADFAARQRRTGLRAEAGLDHWRRRLAGASGPELPTDRPRPDVWNPAGNAERFTVPAPLTGRLHALAARNSTTVFTVLAAAVQLVLARYCAQDDIAVATVASRRDRTEYRNLVGFFVNTVVLRTQVDEALSFAGLLARVWDTVREALDHADTPFERVVATLGQGGDPRRPAVTRVAVVLQNTPAAGVDLPGLRVEEVDLESATAPFDLTFDFREGAGELTAELRYRTDLFDAATVAGIGRHLFAVLDDAAADPGTPLHRFPLTGPAERHGLSAPGAGLIPPFAGSTVTELFDAALRRAPLAPAVRAQGRTTTYGELDLRSRDLAARLTARGVRRGDRVRVVLAPGTEAVTAFLALARIGAAYLSAEPDAPPGRLAAIAADSGAVLVLDADTALPPAPPHTTPPRPPGPDDPLAVVHTSGSTGRPKGVVLTHGGVVNLLSAYAAAFGSGAGERHGQVADLSFDASVAEIWAALCQGACLCVADPSARRDPRALGRWVAEEDLTRCFFPTSLGERLFADGSLAGARRLRHVLVGGERLTRLPAAAAPFTVTNVYGPTEATVIATWYDTTGWPGTAPPPIGRPLPGVRCHVLDRWLRPVPAGVTGELYLGGPGVAQGYLGAPGPTAARFVADPFAPGPGARMYRTGDLVRRRADGLLDYRGRTDRQIKTGGVRVELDEIEHLLTRHPGVAEAAAVAVRESGGHLGVRAFVTAGDPGAGAPPADSTLRDWLRRHLPPAAVPGSVTLLDALPRTAAGKTDLRELAARDASEAPHLEPAVRAPRTPTEQAVARVWEALLESGIAGTQPDLPPGPGPDLPPGPRPGTTSGVTFDVRQKFFDVGGSSLKLMDLRGRLERMAEVELPIALLLEHPTIEAMAKLVDQRRGAPADGGTGLEL